MFPEDKSSREITLHLPPLRFNQTKGNMSVFGSKPRNSVAPRTLDAKMIEMQELRNEQWGGDRDADISCIGYP